ncbi:MAG: acetylglutamate kinase [Candidatus Omnitrophota bacterium]
MEEIIRKADVLIEALPYIKAFHKKILVIKYGGSILGEDKIRLSVLEDIVFLSYMGLEPVLVHGGGPSITDKLKEVGKKTEFVDGMRVTDSETLNIVRLELDKLNAQIVKEIIELGSEAEGFGKDANIIQVKKKKIKAKKDLGFVGEIIEIDAKPIKDAIKKGKIPVISPMGIASDKKAYNVNADEAAYFVAKALNAEKIVLLTNVKGIMRNPEDVNSFIPTLTIQEAKNLIQEAIVQEGMIPKINAAIWALESGVKKAHVIDARLSHALLLEIFTDRGIGTEIIR